MRSRLGIALLLIVAFAAFCSSQTKELPQDNQSRKSNFSFGRMWESCDETDNMVFGMTLTAVETKCDKNTFTRERPYIEVQFSEDPGKRGPVSVLWSNRKGSAFVSRCLTERSPCDQATGGTLDFSRPRPALPSYQLKFTDGSLESGTFTTLAHCQPTLCG
jgi:hypothetical protein